MIGFVTWLLFVPTSSVKRWPSDKATHICENNTIDVLSRFMKL